MEGNIPIFQALLMGLCFSLPFIFLRLLPFVSCFFFFKKKDASIRPSKGKKMMDEPSSSLRRAGQGFLAEIFGCRGSGLQRSYKGVDGKKRKKVVFFFKFLQRAFLSGKKQRLLRDAQPSRKKWRNRLSQAGDHPHLSDEGCRNPVFCSPGFFPLVLGAPTRSSG